MTSPWLQATASCSASPTAPQQGHAPRPRARDSRPRTRSGSASIVRPKRVRQRRDGLDAATDVGRNDAADLEARQDAAPAHRPARCRTSSSGRSRSSPSQVDAGRPRRGERAARCGSVPPPRAKRSRTSRSVVRVSAAGRFGQREPLAGRRPPGWPRRRPPRPAWPTSARPSVRDRRRSAFVVARLAQRAADADVEAGLLEHLAHGALEVGLARRQLALRQAPVVVARAVDDGDLDPGSPFGPVSADATRRRRRREWNGLLTLAHVRQRPSPRGSSTGRGKRREPRSRAVRCRSTRRPGLERVGDVTSAAAERLADRRLGDRGVLDDAEQILERRRPVRRARCGLAHACRPSTRAASSDGVSRALRRDPRAVKRRRRGASGSSPSARRSSRRQAVIASGGQRGRGPPGRRPDRAGGSPTASHQLRRGAAG